MSDYQPYYSESYALVIGINTYEDAAFVPLGEAEADAFTFAQLLSERRFGFKVKTLLGEQATRSTILEQVYRLNNANPNDRILLYFAGHGYTVTDRFGAETGYLACYDTEREKHFTALELDELLDLRRHTDAKHVAFIFDACFSGQALGLTRSAPATAERFLTRRAYQVISAGAGDQTVSDFNSMTDVIVERLAQDGISTVNSLGLYVQRIMAGQSGNLQIPQFGSIAGSQGGDFIFEVRADPADVPEIDPEDVTEAIAIVRRSQLRKKESDDEGSTPSSNMLPIAGVGAVVVLAVLIGAILLFLPNNNSDLPNLTEIPSTPALIYTDETTQASLVPNVTAAVERYDDEFRFALETGQADYIGSAAGGQALQARIRALEILEEAGDCRWDYDHRGLSFISIQFVSDRKAQVTALVDRDGTVICGQGEEATERPQYAFEGPLYIEYELQFQQQRWLVVDTENLTD